LLPLSRRFAYLGKKIISLNFFTDRKLPPIVKKNATNKDFCESQQAEETAKSIWLWLLRGAVICY